MPDDERHSNYQKSISISQVSKRNKLTLSLGNSAAKFSSSSNIGQLRKGKLEEELLQLSTGSVSECSAHNANSCATCCGHKENHLCETNLDDDVISIKSDLTNLEEDAACAANSKIESSNSYVDDIEVIEHVIKAEKVSNCPQDVSQLAHSGNISGENGLDLNCSLQATCHTVATVPVGGISRTEENNEDPKAGSHEEQLIKLQKSEHDSECKVEAWLCNQSFANVHELVDDDSTVEDSELKNKREQCVGEAAHKFTSEFFTDAGVQENPVSQVQQCPLCLKTLDKNVTSHLKSCTAKHKLTTQQLLEALELQRKQEEERRILGLPVVKPAAANKKSSASRKGTSTSDVNLQLALALSASLLEAEEREQDMLLESGMTETERLSLSPSVIQRQLLLLENFGFTSSRPALPTCRQKTSLSKARLKSYALLNRTKEERERLITEKVAIILMGEEDKETGPICSYDKWQDITHVTSELLLKFQDKKSQLWEMARETSQEVHKDLYYVQSLASHISPCKVEPGTKLKHLSQIQGRINTPKNSSKNKNIKVNVSPVVSNKVTPSKLQNQERKENSKKVKKLLDFSSVTNDSLRTVSSTAKKQLCSVNSSSLSEDWASVMNKQAMSDVTIHVSGGREIPAHKLVLYVRCPALLYDLIKEVGDGKMCELLMWTDVSYETALAFLEFLYCGTMNRILHLGDDVSSLKNLARQYQVTEIIQHLEVIHKVRAHVTHNDSDVDFPKSGEENVPAKSPNNNIRRDKIVDSSISPYHETASTCLVPMANKNTQMCSENSLSQCSSPDMFDGTIPDECATGANASQESRASVECLLSLMDKGMMSNLEKPGVLGALFCKSQSSNDGSVTNKCKLNNISSGSCETFPLKDLVPADQKYSDVARSVSSKIISDELYRHTNNSASKNIPLNSDMKKKNSGSSIPEINKTQLTMDLTQDSSDEEFPEQQDLATKNILKCEDNLSDVNSRLFDEQGICVLSEELGDSDHRSSNIYSHSKQLDSDVVEGKPCTPRKEYSDGNSEQAGISFVDNVWDDFDDMGVVPNLSFYSSPSHNREMLSFSRQKSVSPNAAVHSISGSLQTSAHKRKSKIKRPSETITMKVNSPFLDSAGDVLPSAVSGTQKKDGNFKDLLEDSFVDNLNSSALWHGECEEPQKLVEGSLSRTPNEPQKVVTDKVTPLPDYSTMKTPLLKKELFRYGLKALKRKHAKQILRHIYNELHPFVNKEGSGPCSIPTTLPTSSQSSRSLFKEPGPDTVVPKSPVKKLSKSPSPKKRMCVEATSEHSSSDSEDLSQSSSCSSVSSDSCMAEEMIPEMEMLSQADSDACERDSVDFRNAVHQYIKNTPELYEKILQYEPIWLEQLQADLKAQKLKFNIKQLMDYLDEQCITFRMAQGQRSRARRKERKRKSSSSLSQLSRGRPKKACTQPS